MKYKTLFIAKSWNRQLVFSLKKIFTGPDENQLKVINFKIFEKNLVKGSLFYRKKKLRSGQTWKKSPGKIKNLTVYPVFFRKVRKTKSTKSDQKKIKTEILYVGKQKTINTQIWVFLLFFFKIAIASVTRDKPFFIPNKRYPNL